jgi:hypothetical protein
LKTELKKAYNIIIELKGRLEKSFNLTDVARKDSEIEDFN